MCGRERGDVWETARGCVGDSEAAGESTPRSAEDQTNRENVPGAGCLSAIETGLLWLTPATLHK